MNQSCPSNRARKRISKRVENPIGSRDMCFRCMRPTNVCHCETIPTIENKTEVLIAQYIQERSHPFNTARMVAQSLSNSRLVTGYCEDIHEHTSLLGEHTGLLYPSKTAIELSDVPADQRPKQLVLLDGTWNQAKRLYRNWPALKNLPHYKLAPSSPGQYRIRLEPDEFSLSTVEATAAALKLLEPDLSGLDDLLQAFTTMVDRQLAHPNADYTQPLQERPPTFNFPHILLDRAEDLVVAYGEAEPLLKGAPKKNPRAPAFWAAKRITCGSKFQAAIESNLQLTDQLLDYFELDRVHVAYPLSNCQFRERWNAFVRPTDIVVVYNNGCLRLLNTIGIQIKESLALRAVNFNPKNRGQSLTSFFEAHKYEVSKPEFPGRAGKRLANLETLIKFLCKQFIEKNELSNR